MGDINNNYKRFQSYQGNTVKSNNFKHDYVEQHYKINDNKPLGEKREFGEKRELPKSNNSFLRNASRLGVNKQGQFFKK